ncbi:MAG: hypothetical protein KIT25_12165 [Enhydrobacter sp.]|nr:MAG: hypothetical protein KIT25_12165 [Enhydrobacter sp.]
MMEGEKGFFSVLAWFQHTALAQEIRGGTWSYAALEVVHLIGVACLVGSILAFDLRLMGLSRGLEARGMMRHLLPLAAIGFALAAASGSLMFMADAVALAANRAFQVKLVLILLAGLNALACHRGPLSGMGAWNRHVAPPWAARAMAVFSLVFWLAVVACGRLIAYV